MRSLQVLSPFLAVLVMLGSSCQKFSLDTDDLDIKLDLNIIKTHITVQYKNARTGEFIGAEANSRIPVSVFGPDSQWVVNNSGERKNGFHAASGYLSIGLDPYHAKPSAEDPVNFTLTSEFPGYLSTSLPVTLTSEGGYDFVVNMVEVANPPVGVSILIKDNIGIMSEGRLAENISESTGREEVMLSIPQGTVMKDSSGESLDGPLNIMICYFDPTMAESLGSFPGGLSVEVTGEQGSLDQGIFNTAGFMKVEITDRSGREAVTFERGVISLNGAISEEIINPETGQPVKAGMKIPVWSFNGKSGNWKFENRSEMVSGTSGSRLSTTFSHLSWWNFGWFESSCRFEEISFTTDDQSKSGKTGWDYGFYYIATVDGINNYRAEGYFSGYPAMSGVRSRLSTEILQGLPLNSRVRFTFSPSPGKTPLWNVPEPFVYNFCEGSPLEIPLTANTGATGVDGDRVTIAFTIEIFCTDYGAAMDIPDNTQLRYRVKGANVWGSLTAFSGQVTIAGFLSDTLYEVQVLFNDEWVPTSDFEYHVDASFEPGETRKLRFELNCGD